MAAEFHFAENALALHLLLQRPESLVDIVIADENLHAAFLFDRAVDGTEDQGARAAGIRLWTLGADGGHGTNSSRYKNGTGRSRYLKAGLPMGAISAKCGNGCQLAETEISVGRRF